MVFYPSFKDLECPFLVFPLYRQEPHLHTALPFSHSMYIPLLESGWVSLTWLSAGVPHFSISLPISLNEILSAFSTSVTFSAAQG